MANRAQGLRAEVVPAWRAFVAEALPAGSVSRAAAAVSLGPRASTMSGSYANSPDAAFLRRVANGGVGQPEPGTVWFAAEAARTLEGHEWCAGPLFLFAAGHFVRFSHVMLHAEPQLVTATRRRALVDAVVHACAPTQKLSDLELERDLHRAGISETVLRTQLRRRRARPVAAVRPERNVWILTDAEEAAFTDAYLRQPEAHEASTVAARLVEMHRDVPLALQREIVCTLLRAAFT